MTLIVMPFAVGREVDGGRSLWMERGGDRGSLAGMVDRLGRERGYTTTTLCLENEV